jgi:hypothetical protein
VSSVEKHDREPDCRPWKLDGDLQIPEWTAAVRWALRAVVHHDDAAREFAYDRAGTLQKFSVGWDEALAKGWTVLSMQKD